MKHFHEITHVLGVILGGCVGMWMGGVLALIVRLLHGVFLIRVIGTAHGSSLAEMYQDGMFILALIMGAWAGARFAHGFLREHEDRSAGFWK